MISILIVADHAMVRHGLYQLLNFTQDMSVIGQASDALEALALCEEHRPDVVLVDIAMSKREGVRATRLIHQHFAYTRVMLLSDLADAALSREALRVGARQVLAKEASIDQILETIRMVYGEC